MDMIPIRCPEEGCGGVVLIAEAFHDDHDDLIGLTCPKQHRFDYDKHRCPRCGSPAAPARWDIVRASSFSSLRSAPVRIAIGRGRKARRW